MNRIVKGSVESPSIIKHPQVDISPEILEELKTQIHEMGQVVVHCIQISTQPSYIRIWPSTYLYDQHSDHESELIHAEKISYYPQWTAVGKGETHFTLVFSGLPKSCLIFDLYEQCSNQGGAFKVNAIVRNSTDVYYVQV